MGKRLPKRRLKASACGAAGVALIVLASAASVSAQQAHDAHAASARDAPLNDSLPSVPAAMPAALGPYAMSREASGTSWQPDATPMQGRAFAFGEWSGMLHGSFHFVTTEQRGPRGDSDTYSANMLMGMLSRPVGQGRFGARGMLTLEPDTIGNEGYPLLLQTGETADGFSHLLDRQHAHDTFMELALTYSRPLGDAASIFFYGGLSGEPAIGPPAFMHRFSGMDFPDSPISHHWLDSTHITYRVLTAGLVRGDMKVEVSAFRGREPDQYRWDLERGGLDSHSIRVSYNAGSSWSMQISTADIESPEQLAPRVDNRRTTASALHHRSFGGREWQTLIAWGRNDNEPGNTLNAVLLESAYRFRMRHSLLGRAEWAQEDELVPHVHVPGQIAALPVTEVARVSVGYLYDFIAGPSGRLGVGVVASMNFVDDVLEPFYGGDPAGYSLYLRGRF